MGFAMSVPLPLHQCGAADDSEEEEEEEAKEPETPQPTPEEREAARAAAAAAAAAAAEAQRLADQQLSKKVHFCRNAELVPEKGLFTCVNVNTLWCWFKCQNLEPMLDSNDGVAAAACLWLLMGGMGCMCVQEQKRLEMEKLKKDLEELGIQPGAHLFLSSEHLPR